MRKCVCQICVCGRHRCEHTRRRRVPFAKDDEEGLKTTEHKERYKYFGFQPREKPVKPPSEAKWKGDEPTIKLSTTRKDFVAFPIKKRSLIRPKESSVPQGTMADTTTYQYDYSPKKAMRSKVRIPEPEGKNGTMPGTLPGKIQTVTTYSKCYTPKPLEKREKAAAAKECTLTEFGKPFTGQTETALSYQPHPLEKREILLPLKSTLKHEGDFTDVTTHQTDFTPKYVAPERPVKKFGKLKPAEGKFEDETTHKHDYRCPPQPEKAISCLPKPEIEKIVAPFEGKSRYKQDFQPYKVLQRMLPEWHPKYKPYKASTLPFEGETTYRIDYEPPPEDLPQYEQIKPLKCSLTIPSGPMEKLTTFMRDYRKIECPVLTKSFKPQPKYEKPKEKFTGCTVTRADYTPKEHEKLQISKAKDNLKPGKGPMDDKTMTMKDFQWLALECPATYLKLFGKDALPNYVFDKTEHGHDFYKRLNGKKGPKKSSSIKHEKSKKSQKIKQK